MKEKMKKITNKKAKNIIFDKDALNRIEKTREMPLEIEDISSNRHRKTNHLIEIEIAFRKCDRFGVFN